MKTLIGKVPDDFNEKRFYFKGVIKVKCPKCQEQIEHDFEDQYLSYPEIGKPAILDLYCEKCDSNFEMPIIVKSIDVVLDYDDEKIIEEQ